MLVAAAALPFGITADAHHSLEAVYEMDREVQIEGKVLQVLIRSPHSFLHVEASAEGSANQRWAIEWQSAGKLSKRGIQRDTLRVGDELTVVVHPGRKLFDHRGVLIGFRRNADGLEWTEQPKRHRIK
jgi:uncharacterized protein DUF6152